jgi:protein gp37
LQGKFKTITKIIMAKTSIEWTEKTWNPIISGCSIISQGCQNCYAMKMAGRLEAMEIKKYKGLTRKTSKGKIIWNGKINIDLNDKALYEPLKTKKPTMYFVNSMTDLFHEDVPFEAIDKIMAVIALCPQHTFQVLTKRADRMKEYFDTPYLYKKIRGEAVGITNDFTLGSIDLPLPNLWLGVSVENQEQADIRIPYLLETPAQVRFLSCEPLLEQVYLPSLPKIDWVIVGGESGKDTRPMHPDWVRYIRNQCEATGVKFFFKQWGEWIPLNDYKERISEFGSKTFETINQFDNTSFAMVKVGKKKAGVLLDGKEYREMPKI